MDQARNFYARQLARKQAQLSAVEADLEACSSRKDELRLTRDAEQLLGEIKELEKRLSDMDMQSNDMTVKLPAIDKTLRKIDFSKAREIAFELCRNFETQDGGFALFLLQRATKQMGYYCLHEMLGTLFEHEFQESLLQANKDGSCKVYDVNLESVGAGGTELECLKQLLRYEGIDAYHQNLAELGKTFQKSLCASLRSGDRVVLLIKDWHYVEPKDFLDWFVKDFWKSLIDEIQHRVLPEYGRIKVVAVLASGGQISSNCLTDLTLWTSNSFEPHHIIDIPLPDWTVIDIEKWLMDVQKLGRTESNRSARRIHAESEGTPQTICSILKERYSA